MRGENNAPSNNSMDVRAKQRLCYQWSFFNSELRVFGFAPRHLSRCAAAKAEEVYHSETFGKTGTDFVRFE
ncbi:MAG: hypothetical protein H0X49_16795 [Acidobacteria bacterium]|nr:hypothetical protein [Acidobacteriota bacterium]